MGSSIKFKTENIMAFLLFIGLILYPLMASDYNVQNITNFLAKIFLSLSLSLIWGYAGIFSFGHAAFFGIGGYVYGIISLNFANQSFTLISLILGVLAGGFIAWIIGYFMFYGGINDVFVGLITLSVTLVFETFMAQTAGSQWKIGSVPLGGYNGINGIPPISLSLGKVDIMFTGDKFYYLVLFILLCIYLLLRKLLVSRWGYALIAIRDNRERSLLFGYDVPKIQTMFFALSGALSSLGGILYAMWGGYMTPSMMGLSAATLPIVLVAAGGRKNLTAAMIFTLIYSWFSQRLSSSGSQYALVILGIVLLLVVLFVPEGIFVTLFDWFDRIMLSHWKKDTNAVKTVKDGVYEK